ncbi:hypothetical protein Btru_002325 [Bulinus truncatus]|nr:hypothetical protein Btru_002325 [Bulinus truncatus]
MMKSDVTWLPDGCRFRLIQDKMTTFEQAEKGGADNWSSPHLWRGNSEPFKAPVDMTRVISAGKQRPFIFQACVTGTNIFSSANFTENDSVVNVLPSHRRPWSASNTSKASTNGQEMFPQAEHSSRRKHPARRPMSSVRPSSRTDLVHTRSLGRPRSAGCLHQHSVYNRDVALLLQSLEQNQEARNNLNLSCSAPTPRGIIPDASRVTNASILKNQAYKINSETMKPSAAAGSMTSSLNPVITISRADDEDSSSGVVNLDSGGLNPDSSNETLTTDLLKSEYLVSNSSSSELVLNQEHASLITVSSQMDQSNVKSNIQNDDQWSATSNLVDSVAMLKCTGRSANLNTKTRTLMHVRSSQQRPLSGQVNSRTSVRTYIDSHRPRTAPETRQDLQSLTSFRQAYLPHYCHFVKGVTLKGRGGPADKEEETDDGYITYSESPTGSDLTRRNLRIRSGGLVSSRSSSPTDLDVEPVSQMTRLSAVRPTIRIPSPDLDPEESSRTKRDEMDTIVQELTTRATKNVTSMEVTSAKTRRHCPMKGRTPGARGKKRKGKKKKQHDGKHGNGTKEGESTQVSDLKDTQ